MSGAETRRRSPGVREGALVGEHCRGIEAAPEGAVERREERMPE